MILIAIVGVLFAVATIAYWWGAWKLAQYGFRISTGTGLAVLLFPPFTFMFAMKLQESGKELPMASWLFGIVSSALLTGIFFQPLTMIASGRMDEIAEEKTTKDSIEEKPAPKVEKPVEVKPVETPKVEPTTPTPTTGTLGATGQQPPTDGAAKVAPAKTEPAKTESPKADAKPVEKKADAPK